MKKLVVVVRIAGKTGLRKGVKDTFKMMRLYKKHTCVIIPNTENYQGMLKKVSSYVTWGEIDEPTLKLILQKRGRIMGHKPLTDSYVKTKTNLTIEQFASEVFNFKKKLSDLPGIKLFFRLKPPEGGFEKEGIKQQFSLGGVLGYRKDKINDLIKKMI